MAQLGLFRDFDEQSDDREIYHKCVDGNCTPV